MKSIALVGFMGSGKTTTASAIGKILNNINIINIDDNIEKNSEKIIKDIFSEYGESFFRELEHNEIKKAIENNTSLILDLGGGAFIQEKNRNLLKEKNITTIFLNVPMDVLRLRLENQRELRPMLNQKNWSDIENILNERLKFYEMADISIKIAKEDDVNVVVNKVKEILKNEKN